MSLFPQIKLLFAQKGGIEYPYLHQIYWDGEIFYEFISRYNITFIEIYINKNSINKNDFIYRKLMCKLNEFEMDRFVNRLFKLKKIIFNYLFDFKESKKGNF